MIDLNGFHTAILLLIAYVGIKAVDQVFIIGWRKMFGTRYVTDQECEKLRSQCAASVELANIKKDIHDLKVIMVNDIINRNNLTPEQKNNLEKMVV